MSERVRQQEFESRFFEQLRARSLALTGAGIPAHDVVIEATPEALDALRDDLSRLEVFDRGALDELPGGRSERFTFRKKQLGGLLRSTTAHLRARVLVDVPALTGDRVPERAGREAILDALARYKLLPKKHQPSMVVLASPTGFSAAAEQFAESNGDPPVVLLGGREDGGWDLTLPSKLRNTPWEKLFALESLSQKLGRVQEHLREEAARLDGAGVPLAELADKLGLSVAETERLLRQACRTDPRLMTVTHDDVVRVCRVPLVDERQTMSIWSRVRKLFGMKPTPAERVREMTTQRVRLEQQRHEVDEKISRLEADERKAIDEGAAAVKQKNAAVQQQAAGRLQRVRRELRRYRSQAQLYTQQIDIIGTQIHNVTLAEEGRRVSLPKAEELTKQAAEAEQVVGEIAASADLASQIEVSAESQMQHEEQADILAEFRAVAEQDEAEPASEAADERATPESTTDEPPPIPETREAPEKRARPEPN